VPVEAVLREPDAICPRCADPDEVVALARAIAAAGSTECIALPQKWAS
jgi:hypothetical protein